MTGKDACLMWIRDERAEARSLVKAYNDKREDRLAYYWLGYHAALALLFAIVQDMPDEPQHPR